jgi:hypothetical protein
MKGGRLRSDIKKTQNTIRRDPIGATDNQRILCAKTELAVTPLAVFEVDVHGVVDVSWDHTSWDHTIPHETTHVSSIEGSIPGPRYTVLCCL